MSSASIVAIIGLSVGIVGVGVRLIAAFKPPKSERAKNALGNVGYGITVIGLLVLISLAWHLYVPLSFQSPIRWTSSLAQLSAVRAPQSVATPAVQKDLKTSGSSTPIPLDSWQNRPPVVQGGPIGPIFAVEYLAQLKQLPRCVLKLTAPPGNENIREALQWIAQAQIGEGGAGCTVTREEAGLPDVDITGPTISDNSEPGIIIHWNENFREAERLVHFFDSSDFDVRISHRLPSGSPPDRIWIDIGPGSPWKH